MLFGETVSLLISGLLTLGPPHPCDKAAWSSRLITFLTMCRGPVTVDSVRQLLDLSLPPGSRPGTSPSHLSAARTISRLTAAA